MAKFNFRQLLNYLPTLGTSSTNVKTSYATSILGYPHGTGVNEETAMNFSAVWACVKAISGPFSYFDINIYNRSTGFPIQDPKHLALKGFREPLPGMTKNKMFEMSCTHYLTWGNSFIEFGERPKGYPSSYYVHNPEDIDVNVKGCNPQQKIAFHFKGKKKRTSTGYSSQYIEEPRDIASNNMFFIAGPSSGQLGDSVIKHANKDIAGEFSAQVYGNKFFDNGGVPNEILFHKGPLKKEQQEQIKQSWENHKRKGGTAVLGGDWEHKTNSIPPEDAQFLGTRSFNVTTIARWFGVPPHMIQDLTNGATFNNVEEAGQQFLKSTMQPIVEKYEAEFTNKLFGPDGKFFVKINMNDYLRTDTGAQAERHRTQIQNGILTPNEARAEEMRPPLEGGDAAFIQKNMYPLDGFSEMVANENNNNNEPDEDLV